MLLVAVACNQAARDIKKVAKAAVPGGPQIQATVVTIRTALQPGKKITTSTIVIGSDVARQANEIGTWRLFDVKNERVAFVDDVAKTYRYESLKSLAATPADPPSDGAPRAQLAVSSVRRIIMGVPATQAVVRLGGYQREVWIGLHPLIPPTLFALMDASDGSADNVLSATRGFPLLDHAEIAYGNSKFVVDRAVLNIERKNVPEALLQIPASYRDVTATAPAARHPGASSPPRDQRTREEGSRSSARDRTGP